MEVEDFQKVRVCIEFIFYDYGFLFLNLQYFNYKILYYFIFNCVLGFIDKLFKVNFECIVLIMLVFNFYLEFDGKFVLWQVWRL